MSIAFYSPELRCPGVGRDGDNSKALCFYFNRPVSDEEMRFLHNVMQRAVAVSGGSVRGDYYDGERK